MQRIAVNGINLAYEEFGEGFPLVWAHEQAGSFEVWRGQAQFFARRYRVIAYNARGYPPSDVPEDPAAYSLDQAVEDLYGLLKALGIEQAYIGGLSMGGGLTVRFGLSHPEMCKGLIIASAGTGSTNPEVFRQENIDRADAMERAGQESLQAVTSSRPVLKRKDPIAWQRFVDQYLTHSAVGMARVMRGVQAKRPPLFEYEAELRRMQVPALILVGDDDENCIEPGLFLKRTIPRSGLVMFPQAGHSLNVEEPDMFNHQVLNFLTAVEAGKWFAKGE